MRVLPTNSDPYCTGAEFLHAIDAAGGIPERVRTDCGTENVVIAAVQSFLRRNHGDQYAGLLAHMYGPSYLNQRIEAFWSIFKRVRAAHLIEMFKV